MKKYTRESEIWADRLLNLPEPQGDAAGFCKGSQLQSSSFSQELAGALFAGVERALA